MKKIFYIKKFFIVLLSSIFLGTCACDSPNQTVVDDTKSNYTEEQISILESLCGPSELTMAHSVIVDYISLNDAVTADYIREAEDYFYAVYPIIEGTEQSYFFLLFNNDNILLEAFRTDKLPTEESFENIKVGKTTMEEIKAIDKYMYIFTGDVITSSHKFTNGNIAEILYTEDGIVESITIQTDPIAFVNKLTDEDKELIT